MIPPSHFDWRAAYWPAYPGFVLGAALCGFLKGRVVPQLRKNLSGRKVSLWTLTAISAVIDFIGLPLLWVGANGILLLTVGDHPGLSVLSMEALTLIPAAVLTAYGRTVAGLRLIGHGTGHQLATSQRWGFFAVDAACVACGFGGLYLWANLVS